MAHQHTTEAPAQQSRGLLPSNGPLVRVQCSVCESVFGVGAFMVRHLRQESHDQSGDEADRPRDPFFDRE